MISSASIAICRRVSAFCGQIPIYWGLRLRGHRKRMVLQRKGEGAYVQALPDMCGGAADAPNAALEAAELLVQFAQVGLQLLRPLLRRQQGAEAGTVVSPCLPGVRIGSHQSAAGAACHLRECLLLCQVAMQLLQAGIQPAR